MKNVFEILETLIKLQELQLKSGRLAAATQEETTRLRAEIPGPILAHFDRMIARGKKGVAIASHGVCSGCHLKISSGTWGNLRDADSIHLCDSCGRYLYLPPASQNVPPPLPPLRVKPRKRAPKQDVDLAA